MVLFGVYLQKSARAAEKEASGVKSIRALMITGGCCHDYETQKLLISAGISERAKVEWEIVHEGGTSTDHKVSIYARKNWGDAFDVVVYNKCFAKVSDAEFVKGITSVHEAGLPAVVLHCTMHTYRDLKDDDWRKFLGVTSKRHGRHHPITVDNLKPDHPVMKGFPKQWKTPRGELYHIIKTWPSATPLGNGYLTDPDDTHHCIWVNQFGKARVFATTIGHHNETMQEKTYLDLLTRGLLWSVNQLDDSGKPRKGYTAE